jgi:serine/threonine-protein kinase HipA
MRALDVCLDGERIGTLQPAAGGGYELAYAPAAVAKHGSGTVLLSHSLPIRAEPYSVDTTRAYVEGLLPCGPRRRRLAAELGVDPADGYALVGALGYDCPGAVTFGAGEAAPRAAAVAGSRIALAGDREKYGLVRDGIEGPWERPRPGRPSTHVVKPEPEGLPEIVVNEMFCTSVMRQAGLPAAKATLEKIDGRDCLVSPRFDLAWDGPEPRRLHQETFCQALGVDPTSPDQDANAPGFAEASGLLRAVGQGRQVPTLVHAAFVNHVLGNGDSHGRNFALVFRDVTSTVVYDEMTYSGMVLPDDLDVTTYLRGLHRVAEECGTDLEIFHVQASCALKYVCDAIETVARRAESQGWYAPVIDRISDLARVRAGRCAERLLLLRDHLDK